MKIKTIYLFTLAMLALASCAKSGIADSSETMSTEPSPGYTDPVAVTPAATTPKLDPTANTSANPTGETQTGTSSNSHYSSYAASSAHSTSSNSSRTVNSCVVSQGTKTSECVQFFTVQTTAGCKASAGDLADSSDVTITAATSCPAGSLANCTLPDDSTGKKIGTLYAYDSTTAAYCDMLNAM